MSNFPPNKDVLNAGSDLGVVVETAIASCSPRELDPDVPESVIVPQGARLEIPDLKAWRQSPSRKTGVYQFSDVASLVAYGKRFAGGEETVWVHPTSGRAVIVLDDDPGGEPGWGEHRAVLTLKHTPEWDFWLGQDRKAMGQESFAEHIEEGAPEIIEPEAAAVLEIAQTFHATTKASFRQATRLTSGAVQFQYDEETTAKAGRKGDLTIPTAILLELAPFYGEEERRLVARLRYRIREGALTLSYHLERPDAVIRDALDGVADTLRESFPNVYIGEPKP